MKYLLLLILSNVYIGNNKDQQGSSIPLLENHSKEQDHGGHNKSTLYNHDKDQQGLGNNTNRKLQDKPLINKDYPKEQGNYQYQQNNPNPMEPSEQNNPNEFHPSQSHDQNTLHQDNNPSNNENNNGIHEKSLEKPMDDDVVHQSNTLNIIILISLGIISLSGIIWLVIRQIQKHKLDKILQLQYNELNEKKKKNIR